MDFKVRTKTIHTFLNLEGGRTEPMEECIFSKRTTECVSAKTVPNWT
ncbi:unnamed protein product [Gulo gulo]|uniref:Uncharacterized protein n=1 Tax=Gulo gulo TaxID=48420 RepID=A0A9X9Q1W0_GULGU|nr:unnamed protein product [Gulo gulo]